MNKEFLDYVRHLSKQDTKTLSQKALKTTEEVGELARVVLPYDNAFGTTHRFIEREKILEESVDVILTAISIAYDLDFTDDEIDEMLIRKAEKWALRQSKETDLTYPIPYEVHVTVQLENVSGEEVQEFRDACAKVGVKPIVLDLQNSGKSVMTDVMTSSKHFGDNRSALAEATRISTELKAAGFNVVRVKIETVPWHPAAPQLSNDTMPPNCYFESHIPVTLTENELITLQNVCGDLGLHLSRNIYKRNEDGTFVVMATKRLTTEKKSEFQDTIQGIRDALEAQDFLLGKAVVEFSVYDTKISHDTSWISKG